MRYPHGAAKHGGVTEHLRRCKTRRGCGLPVPVLNTGGQVTQVLAGMPYSAIFV